MKLFLTSSYHFAAAAAWLLSQETHGSDASTADSRFPPPLLCQTLEISTMLKKFLFAVAPMVLVASSVMADDSLLSSVAKMDLDGAVADTSQVDADDDLGQADVDALLGEGEEQSAEEAVAACFRRIGYGYRSYGYRSYGYRSYGYRSWCNPCYRSYYSYPSLHCYRPVSYSCYTPVYSSYWGCW